MANKNTRAVTRKQLKKKMQKWGMDSKEIELCMTQITERQYLKELGQIPLDAPLCLRAEYIRQLRKHTHVHHQNIPHYHIGDDYEPPDDVGYRPSVIDPVLTGVGRATGLTAVSVKRRRAMTKFQYDEMLKEKECSTDKI